MNRPRSRRIVSLIVGLAILTMGETVNSGGCALPNPMTIEASS